MDSTTLSILNKKIRVAVNTNNNFKLQMYNNENQVEINYQKNSKQNEL